MTHIILRSSSADITADRETGNIISVDYESLGGTNEWEDVERFDPATFTDEPEMDVLEIGFWTKRGNYFKRVK